MLPYHSTMKIATALLALLTASNVMAAWPQFGRDPAHTGTAPVTGQPFRVVLAQIVMDPFAQSSVGSLLTHYGVPIIDGANVYVEVKSGTFSGNWQTLTWNVQAFRWNGPSLQARWITSSDWKPVPQGIGGNGPLFEPLFQPIMANGSIYMPGFGGSIFRVDPGSGEILERLGIPAPLDPDTYVTGPLVADATGIVYYNAIAFRPGQPWLSDVRDAWLVRVSPAGQTTMVRYTTLTTGAPAPTAFCLGAFSNSELPWPPARNAIPLSIFCGSQRPGINVGPAIAVDGTIYTVSRAHFNSRWAYIVAINPDLSPKWSTSLRDRFNDGCDVLLPPSGTPGGCKQGAMTGVDPSDNTAGAGRVIDDSSSSPAVAPDGSVIYGAYTRYNYLQGHLMHFDSAGAFLDAYRFGWDITPAIYPHDGSYSIVTKENHYDEAGSYCDDPAICPPRVRRSDDPEGYFLTQLSPALLPEWMARNPNDLEWCINGPAIDVNGTIYANAEDGYLYSFDRTGAMRESILLLASGGQAYTPVALDDAGRIYAQKGGRLFVVGAMGRRRTSRK